MNNKIPIDCKEFYHFLNEERGYIYAYLHKSFNMDDNDLNDIYQESSVALYNNIKDGKIVVEHKDGKLSIQSSSLSYYFLRVCINQTLKLLSKKKRTVPLFEESTVARKNEFLAEKIDTLYHWSTEDLSQQEQFNYERIVQGILEDLPETCRKIFQGYYWNDYTTSAIADIYGYANSDSVKAQKYKCVSKFKEKLKERNRNIYEYFRRKQNKRNG